MRDSLRDPPSSGLTLRISRVRFITTSLAAASYLIGMVHGIGAETPTQMLLFALAISAGVAASKEFGAIIILAYSLGLVATNTLMGALGAYGYIKSSESKY